MTVFSYSGRVKSPECRWQRRRANLRHFEIFRHGPVIIYTRLPAGGTYYPICMFPASSECLISISDTFSDFWLRDGYPSSSPRAYCTPNKSVPTLCYTRRHGPIYTGPCPKALTECSPLDFRRSSITWRVVSEGGKASHTHLMCPRSWFSLSPQPALQRVLWSPSAHPDKTK